MTMAEALEWAADYAKRHELFELKTNARGYADGQTPPSPRERASILTDLASTVYNANEAEKATEEEPF